ncbi:CO dehydrogenase/acetyl-CoA synthase alpha subunit [Paraburkholderia sp. CI2]|nr:CO dehydrogenase/acetyl-CoA synthase alpha subunit [Paraburkholderia sp. CI2]
MLQFFYDEHAGTFSHDKAISSSVERAGCLSGMVIKARGHGSCGGECPQADSIDAGLRSATQGNIGFVSTNQACCVANGLCAGSTCSNRRAEGTTKAVADGYLASCHIGQETGNGER